MLMNHMARAARHKYFLDFSEVGNTSAGFVSQHHWFIDLEGAALDQSNIYMFISFCFPHVAV